MKAIRRAAALATMVIGMVASAQPGLCQMSFSAYNDASANGAGVISLWSTVEDSSSGCSHSNYLTTARIISPNGRQASGTSGGLQAGTSLAINDEFGQYSLVTTASYYCSCSQQNAGFGNSQPAPADTGTSYVHYTLTGSYDDPCTCGLKHCSYTRCTSEYCGSLTFEKVQASCPYGYARNYTYKRFMWVTYICDLLTESPMADYPC
jgi:hypothetical protein